MREVVIFPDPRLREPCTDITVFDAELKKLSEEMLQTMYATDGVGLAAPQIGLNRNLVVIDIPDDEGVQGKNPLVLVNPVIEEKSGELVDSEEGCLSVPEYRATIKRYSHVRVHAQDVNGVMQHYDAEGYTAICMQHEIDHLQGRLFIDYLSKIKRDILRRRYTKFKKEHPHWYEEQDARA